MYPVLTLTPNIQIPMYYLLLSVGLSLAILWLSRRAAQTDLNRRVVLDLSLLIMIAGFLGGRLFHVFYEEPTFYREFPYAIFEFWNGGFVYYGGALAAALTGFLFLYRKDPRRVPQYLDLLAPLLAFTYAIGRVACFFAGCCYGRFCELPWAVAGRHPTQLYAVIWESGVLMILLGLEKIPPAERPRWLSKAGALFFLWMVLHGMGRLLMESFRDDFRGPSWGLSISSWISLAVLSVGIFCLIKRRN